VKKPNFVNGLTEVKVNPHNNEHEYEFASRHGSREASPSNNQNDSSSQDAPLQPPNGDTQFDQEYIPQQPRDDHKSIDPVQTTVIPVVNNDTIIRKSPSLSLAPVQTPVQVVDNTQLLQLYQQLQAQAQAQAQAQSAAPSQARSQAPSQALSQPIISSISPIPAAAAAATVPSVSPANSIRSTSSVPLGQIQTDNNGNQIVNI
jgi:hypothetical protein